MSEARLKSDLLIQAAVRICSRRGVAAMVIRRGDPDAGAICIKLNRMEGGFVVLNQARLKNGQLGWLAADGADGVSEADADACITRATRYDPDLWILEIEDRQGRNPFDDPVHTL